MGEPADLVEKREALKEQLGRLLGPSLGLNIYPDLTRYFRGSAPEPSESESTPKPSSLLARIFQGPISAGIGMTFVFLVAFVLLPWAVARASGDVPAYLGPLLVLQAYGALWSGWATASTHIAQRSIDKVIERLIDDLSAKAIEDVSIKLTERFPSKRRLLLLSWGLGAAAALLAGYLISRDLSAHQPISPWQLGWWCLGWTLLYTTAAKVVNVACFYRIFTEALEDKSVFMLNAARSVAIDSVALIAKRMLLFWLAIAISIALVVPFGLAAAHLAQPGAIFPKWDDFQARTVWDMWFVSVHLIGTSVFSIGLGSLVFLRTEAALRWVAWNRSVVALREIEKQAAKLGWTGPLSENEIKRRGQLRALHADIAQGGSYRTFVLSGLSLIIPFVPLLTLLLKEWLGSG